MVARAAGRAGAAGQRGPVPPPGHPRPADRPAQPGAVHRAAGRARSTGRGRGATRVGLCFLDLDGFKAVNDTLGHRSATGCWSTVAERLRRADSASHLVARLGGDEFVILVERHRRHRRRGRGRPTRALAAVAEPVQVDGHELTVTASVGIVERPVAGADTDRADAGRRHHPALGEGGRRGRWALFDPDRNAARARPLRAVGRRCRPPWTRGEFFLDYQPLVALADGRLRRGGGAGALAPPASWGCCGPDGFIGAGRGDRPDRAARPAGCWREACRRGRRLVGRRRPRRAVRQRQPGRPAGARPGLVAGRARHPRRRPGCRRSGSNWRSPRAR